MKTNRLLGILVYILFIATCVNIFASGAPEEVSTTAPEVPSYSAPDELDMTIREAADYFSDNIPKGNKLLILYIQSNYPDLSEYIIDELIAQIIGKKIFTVVDRANLALIQQEMDFQLSGEVSDESAQSIGQKLGAQTIISGSISKIGESYRLRIRALDVETASIQGQFNRNIPNGATIITLTVHTGAVNNNSTPGRTTSQNTQSTKIGNTGPGGGIVFYDKGNNEGGWQYMEVTSSSLGLTGTGPNTGLRTGTAIGDGSSNTLISMDYLITHDERGTAIQLCADYRGGGYDDWFLPSRDELNAIYTNLIASGFVMNHGMTGWQKTYWSSSQARQEYAGVLWYYQNFTNGATSSDINYFNYDVRAVRQF
jgi:TolB-like protein